MSAPFNPIAADHGAEIIAHNTQLRGWEISDKAHGLAMLLVDLIEYADREGIDFALEVENAREVALDCRL